MGASRTTPLNSSGCVGAQGVGGRGRGGGRRAGKKGGARPSAAHPPQGGKSRAPPTGRAATHVPHGCKQGHAAPHGASQDEVRQRRRPAAAAATAAATAAAAAAAATPCGPLARFAHCRSTRGTPLAPLCCCGCGCGCCCRFSSRGGWGRGRGSTLDGSREAGQAEGAGGLCCGHHVGNIVVHGVIVAPDALAPARRCVRALLPLLECSQEGQCARQQRPPQLRVCSEGARHACYARRTQLPTA